MRGGRTPGRAGFTLVELLVVIAIIGIIISLILVAAADGVRRAEERATQSLITKLDFALNDRIDALFNTQAPINQTHRFLAAINIGPSGGPYTPIAGSIEGRAQVIAQNDFIRAELPDVFFLNAKASGGSTVASRYPLNFAAVPYPPSSSTEMEFVVPLGNTKPGLPLIPDPSDSTKKILTPGKPLTSGIGMFGASYAAAAGIYKNLGYRKEAYDGVDNAGNGYIDEYSENKFDTSKAADKAEADLIALHLNNHTHKTARSEMLYAILVEGLGPLGSVFNREDFTDKEVQDTDNDGLPEFVDAWGEPLQFYRWPIYYGAVPATSDSQKGYLAYGGPSENRQQDPFDPNQQLVAPGWWYKSANPGLTYQTADLFSPPNGTGTSGNVSQGAVAFSNYFRSLINPAATGTGGVMWDRTGAMNRRAYFSKFLVLSSGPDREPGVAQFNKNYAGLLDDPTGTTHTFTFPDPSLSIAANAQRLILIENQASQTDPLDRSGSFFEQPETTGTPGTDNKWQTTQYLRSLAGLDDITNHNISAPGTGVR